MPDARLVIPAERLPEAFGSGRWSVLVWLYAPDGVQDLSHVLSIDGRLSVWVHPGGLSVVASHASRRASLTLPTPLRAGRWHLLAVSMDDPAGVAQAWLGLQGGFGQEDRLHQTSARLVAAGSPVALTTAKPLPDPSVEPDPRGKPSTAWSVPNPPRSSPAMGTHRAGHLWLGATSQGVPAAELVYEALAIRGHPLVTADVRAVWESRWIYAPHSLDTTGLGGRMDGWRSCAFLAFHAVSPNANGPGLPEDKASYIGGPVKPTNLILVDQPRELAAAHGALFMVAVPVLEAHGMMYRSRLEPPLDGFFRIEPPPFEAPRRPVGVIGPKASMLVHGPQGLVRVMVSANSRGVRGTLADQPWPENFAHGFVQALLDRTAGVLMRPATILDDRGGWFGLDTTASTPQTEGVRPLHARTDAWGDWTRFGSGTLPGISRGPGPAVNVDPGGFYRLRCGPVAGSLLRADAPLVVRSTLLAFPGSSDVLWHPERGFMQHGEGLALGEPRTVPLDTTRLEHVLGDADALPDPRQLRLAGRLDVRPGDAVVVTTGPARGSVSVVESVFVVTDHDGDPHGATIVRLSHPFGQQPRTGDTLRIGPWRFVGIEHRFDPVPAGDDRTWRGQVLTAADDGRLGLMVYAVSAWRPDVDGFAFGAAGQSGQGYTPQLESTFPGALSAWAAHAQPDVWIQGLAQQNSQPPAMLDYLHELRRGLGDQAEVVWASDAVHAHAAHDRWHAFLRDQAPDAGVAAIFAVGHPRVGSYFAQAASGMRTDDAHYSSFGSRVIAQAWLDQLCELVLGDCAPADVDGDAAVTVYDVLAYQGLWDAQDPRADLDGDGRLLVFDYLLLLTLMDRCGR